jgi:hypothetical protein
MRPKSGLKVDFVHVGRFSLQANLAVAPELEIVALQARQLIEGPAHLCRLGSTTVPASAEQPARRKSDGGRRAAEG